MISIAAQQELTVAEPLVPYLDCGLLSLSTYGPVEPSELLRAIEFDLNEQGLAFSTDSVVTLADGARPRGCDEGTLAIHDSAADRSVSTSSTAADHGGSAEGTLTAAPVHVARTAPGQYSLSPELADALSRAPLSELGGSTAAPEMEGDRVVSYVLFVSAGSLPSQLGLRTGDRLVEIGGRSVSDPRSLRSLQGARRRGRLSLRVLRGGQPINLSYRVARPE